MLMINNAFIKHTLFRFMYYLPEHIKYGSQYRYIKSLIKQSEHWSEEEIYTYQLQQLQKIIKHAYHNVPYYNSLFKQHQIHPTDIKEISDLKKIPYLTKDIINENRELIKSDSIKKSRLRYATTGGSTGTPMGFYHENVHGWIEWAFMISQWERIGYKDKDKCAVLRGGAVKNIIYRKKYWAHNNWLHPNWLIMSSYHLTDESIPLYYNKLKEFKPRFIQAYPSSLQVLADFMKRNSLPPISGLEGIFCGSENIYDWQRSLFEEVFQTRVYSWYGHTEMLCLAGECEVSSTYHSYPQYGYTELINDNDEWCTEEGEKGEIVATGFWNYYFPMIRYKTQDVAINTNKKCECGRNWKMIDRVEGRLQDYVIGSKGEKITLTALIFAQHFKAFEKIKKMQLYQNAAGKVTVRVVESQKLTNDDFTEIKSKMSEASHKSIDVDINILSDIPLTIRGKHRFLIQEIES